MNTTLVCTRAPAAHRIGAEEFCRLIGGSGSYHPHWQVLRMLAVGQAWAASDASGTAQAALLVLPAEADVGWTNALRSWQGLRRDRSYVLTPPVGRPDFLEPLLAAALASARRRTPRAQIQAVLEFSADLEDKLPFYFAQGFALRAVRPLAGLAPECVLSTGRLAAPQLWLELARPTQLALLLARGWAAVDLRKTEAGCLLGLAQVEE